MNNEQRNSVIRVVGQVATAFWIGLLSVFVLWWTGVFDVTPTPFERAVLIILIFMWVDLKQQFIK